MSGLSDADRESLDGAIRWWEEFGDPLLDVMAPAVEAIVARHVKAAREDEKRRHAERAAAREAEKVRPKLTAEDVRGAWFVRDEYGWHEVVRVSAKSVTVRTPYSWNDRIPLDRVLEVRS